MSQPKRFISTAKIRDGHLVMDDRAAFKRALEQWSDGSAVEVTIGSVPRSGTTQQLRFWFGVAVPMLAEHCGYTKAQMHYALLAECFGVSPGFRDRPTPNVVSIADCSIEQRSELIDWVLVWAPTELGVEIPPPDRSFNETRKAARQVTHA